MYGARTVSSAPGEPGRTLLTLDLSSAQHLPLVLQYLTQLSPNTFVEVGAPNSVVWDPVASKPGCISENGKVFSRLAGSSWDTAAIATQPSTRFTIQILSCTSNCHVMVGFAQKDLFYHSTSCSHANSGWFFNCHNWWKCCHKGASGTYKAGSPLRVGDQVETIYDRANSQISFKVNGANLGVAFNGVTGELHPCVDIAESTSVKLL
eukprot:TRINITY_DN19917_c0_g1_i1.p1 TRINITY_DN19917_c0_g1~~TRINITY_DN19917_c0_g1_i1.p1  ORF type:complete len:207 (+),score=24.53 TRINITY_DN19917_c0_g1_i1:89-709(+)